VLLSWIVLSHGLHNQAFIDDVGNIAPVERIAKSPTWETTSKVIFNNKSGPFGRPLSMASFALDAHYWPQQFSSLIRHNILLHILSGVCVLWFSFLLFLKINLTTQKSFNLALIVSAIWIFHPLLVSTYLYAVQRMTILASIFCLLSLVTYLKLREQFYRNNIIPLIVASLVLSLPIALAILSKENSFTVVSLIGLTELFILAQLGITPDKIRRAILVLALISTSLALLAWIAVYHENYVFASQVRGFDLVERLLTQCRVLVDYLYNSLIPHRAGSGLFHDDIQVSRGLLSPISTLPSLILISALTICAISYFRRSPYLCFAIAWFLLAHLTEASVIPLELKYEHRNYLPMVGLLIGLVLFVNHSFSKRWRALIPSIFLLACITTTFSSVKLWSTPLLQSEIWRAEHPSSMRAIQFSASNWLIRGDTLQAAKILQQGAEYHPQQISLNLQLLRLQCMSNTVDPERLDRLQSIVANGKIDFAIPATIQEFSRTLASTECTGLNLKDTLALIDGVADNPYLDILPRLKAEVIFMLAESYAIARDHSKAAQYSYRSYEIDPDSKYAISEAICWINSGDAEKATIALSRAKNSENSLKPSKADKDELFRNLENAIMSLKRNQKIEPRS
jgi:hypothetical protein